MGLRNLAVLAAAMMSVPAVAAAPVLVPGFSVKIGDAVSPILASNSYQSQFGAAGLQQFTAANASITLTNDTGVSFEFLGSRSQPDDMFQARGGWVLLAENTDFAPWGPISLGNLNYRAGPISDWQFGTVGGATLHGPGSGSFAVFLPAGLQPGDSYDSDVLYLGFDDLANPDRRDHDNLIIRVSAAGYMFTSLEVSGVPEPASWAMLIAGFGLVGAVRRRGAVAA